MTTAKKTTYTEKDSIFTLSNLLTPQECADLIRRMEGRGFTDAPITTYRGFVMDSETRNNTRVMVDDAAHAAHLWERLAPFVPERLGPWRAIGLNERFRYYRYERGQYFKWHCDGAFVRSEVERSLFTAMIYLNEDFEGGTTDFQIQDSLVQDSCTIVPRRGMALLFEHSLYHQGATVSRGRKYVLRSDVMYQRDAWPRTQTIPNDRAQP